MRATWDSWQRWLGIRKDPSGEGFGDAAAAGPAPAREPAAARGWASARYLLLLVVAGALLMWWGSGTPRSPSAPAPPGPPAVAVGASGPGGAEEYARGLERRLAEILSRMTGVGDLDVMVTLEGGPERVLALERSRDRRLSEEEAGGTRRVTSEDRLTEQPVRVRSEAERREEPVVQLERHPRITGVLVVAQGAADPAVRWRILRAVRSLLQLPAHRIYVVEKEGR